MNKRATTVLHTCLSMMISTGLCLGQNINVAPAQTTENTAAVVNRRTITQAEVDDAIISQVFALQQQIYAIRKAALDNLISRALLDEEALRRAVQT